MSTQPGTVPPVLDGLVPNRLDVLGGLEKTDMTDIPRVLNDLGRALANQSEELAPIVAGVVASGWLVHGFNMLRSSMSWRRTSGCRRVLGLPAGQTPWSCRCVLYGAPGRTVVVTAANAGAYTSIGCAAGGLRGPVRGRRSRDASARRCCRRCDAPGREGGGRVGVVTHLYGRAADVSRFGPPVRPVRGAGGRRTARRRSAQQPIGVGRVPPGRSPRSASTPRRTSGHSATAARS